MQLYWISVLALTSNLWAIEDPVRSVTWMTADGLAAVIQGADCSLTTIHGSNDRKSVPASARDIQKISSQDVFGRTFPLHSMGRLHFQLSKKPAEELNIHFARKDSKVIALLVEKKSPSQSKPKFNYQSEDAVVGPVFELSDQEVTYQFQCILNQGALSTEPPPNDMILPYSSGSTGSQGNRSSAGDGAR